MIKIKLNDDMAISDVSSKYDPIVNWKMMKISSLVSKKSWAIVVMNWWAHGLDVL